MMSSSSTAIMVDDDDDSNPPLMATYKHLFLEHRLQLDLDVVVDDGDHRTTAAAAMDGGGDGQQHRLPVIDLQHDAAEHCIVRAASEWGFFQVTNHGVPQALLDELHDAQVAVFRRPFDRKVREPLPGFSPESYRWGTPTATCLEQLSWSEAYHIPMAAAAGGGDGDKNKTRQLVIEEVSTAMSKLALHLAGILIKRGGGGGGGGDDDMMLLARCTRNTCFLRLNRYPPCGGGGGAFGLCPHTDSDVITILHQDGVGGLQLLKSGRWLAVKPNPGALIVNVGDLLQAWSNDRYRSVEHRVVASAVRQRFSVAFFLCPAYDTLIRPRCTAAGDGDGGGPPRYKSFTFGEYRNQVREDVSLTGRKLGLQRFRLHHQHLQDSKEARSSPF